MERTYLTAEQAADLVVGLGFDPDDVMPGELEAIARQLPLSRDEASERFPGVELGSLPRDAELLQVSIGAGGARLVAHHGTGDSEVWEVWEPDSPGCWSAQRAGTGPLMPDAGASDFDSVPPVTFGMVWAEAAGGFPAVCRRIADSGGIDPGLYRPDLWEFRRFGDGWVASLPGGGGPWIHWIWHPRLAGWVYPDSQDPDSFLPRLAY